MGLPNSNPQVLIYWIQLIIGIPCIGLLGNHTGISTLAFCVAIAVILTIGTLFLMLAYSSERTRPAKGRSAFKIVEIVYQLIAWFFYLVIIGIYSQEYDIDQSRSVVHAIQVFTSFNWAAYLFGALLACSEYIWESAEAYQVKRQKEILSRGQGNPTIARPETDKHQQSAKSDSDQQVKEVRFATKDQPPKRPAPATPRSPTAHPAASTDT